MQLQPIYPATTNPAIRSSIRNFITLDGQWEFQIDPKEEGLPKKWFDANKKFQIKTTVPGPVWAIPELGKDYPAYRWANRYEGTCWFKKRFSVDKNWATSKIWLKFGGVMPEARFWLNGKYLGYHRHVQVGFKFDITDTINYQNENTLAVQLIWKNPKIHNGLPDDEMRGGFHEGGFGIWGNVELEQSADIYIEDLFIRPQIQKELIKISLTIHNDSKNHQKLSLQTTVTPQYEKTPITKQISVPPNSQKPINFTFPMKNPRLWFIDDPFLYILTIKLIKNGKVIDEVRERFGMRQLTFDKTGFKLNGIPIILRFDAPEFNWTPTITPIIDKKLIRRRITTLKKLGFNGKRYHTHIPTRQEFDLADELGFLVHSEVSMISNFNETRPYPDTKDTWRYKIKETRNHPSHVIISIGNESSQVYSYPQGFTYRNLPHFKQPDYLNWEREYYAIAKSLAPDHLVIAGTGMQGEFPELPNDFETPHFWSRHFKWAYDGLSALPLLGIKHLLDKAPVVIHEYGKTTIWPNPAEDKLFEKDNMPLKNVGGAGKIALEQAGMGHLLKKVIDYSRRLSATCSKIMIEQLRREPNIAGYHWHCALRVGVNRGMADDLGYKIDPQFKNFIKANQPTTLLIDRDFRGRTLYENQNITIDLHISHFSKEEIKNSSIEWSITSKNKSIEKHLIKNIHLKPGTTQKLFQINFTAPKGRGKLTLYAKLIANKKIIADNLWDFWYFPSPRQKLRKDIVIDTTDSQWERDLQAYFPTLLKLDDVFTTYYGVKTHLADLTKFLTTTNLIHAVISDRWSDYLQEYIKNGGNAILVDRGNFPEDWYHPKVASDAPYDIYSMFVPFRSGWDHGNAATIFENHPILKDFPHEGYADLQCFAMVNGAKTLRIAHLPGRITPIIRVIPIWRKAGPQGGPGPETMDDPAPWETEQRAYLVESKIGKGKLIICSLRLLSDPAGRFLLEKITEYIS